MTINFICIGNAHRSIVAEAYFKSLAIKDVEVKSSGSSADKYRESNKINGYYDKTIALLKRHGLDSFAKTHYGDQVEPGKEVPGDVVVCMNNLSSRIAVKLEANCPKKQSYGMLQTSVKKDVFQAQRTKKFYSWRMHITKLLQV
jgi:protein-tyrosine-phosphatase